MSQSNERALVIFSGALGDFVCFLPALIAVVERHREVVLAARSEWSCILQHPRICTWTLDHPAIRALYGPVFSPTDWQELYGSFDYVYSWSGFGVDTFGRNVRALGASTVAIYPARGFGPKEHARDYFLRCVGLPMPKQALLLQYLRLQVPERARKVLSDKTPSLVVHPGSGAEKKNWKGFPNLVRQWKQCTGGRVIALLGPAEVERNTPPGEVDLTLQARPLPEVGGLLKATPLYLGNDSGVSHLAALLNTPGVVVAGKHTCFTHWKPEAPHLYCLQATEFCTRCGPEVLCEHLLPASQVLHALKEAAVRKSRP